MRLGISSYTCTWAVGVPGSEPERPLFAEGLIDRAVELGASVVQIADNLPLDRLSPSEQAALAGHARQHGVRIEVGTRGSAPDHLRRYLEIARRLHSPLLRTLVDLGDDRPSPGEAAERLRAVVPDLETADVTLAVENHDRLTARQLLDVVRASGSDRVGVCLDTVNSFGALEGPEVVIAALAPHTVNLHVKDFAVMRLGHQMGFAVEGRPAGEGRLDIPAVLAALRHAGRGDISAIVELWTPPAATLTETLAREAEWARRSVAYLRRLIPEDAAPAGPDPSEEESDP